MVDTVVEYTRLDLNRDAKAQGQYGQADKPLSEPQINDPVNGAESYSTMLTSAEKAAFLPHPLTAPAVEFHVQPPKINQNASDNPEAEKAAQRPENTPSKEHNPSNDNQPSAMPSPFASPANSRQG